MKINVTPKPSIIDRDPFEALHRIQVYSCRVKIEETTKISINLLDKIVKKK